PRATLDRPRRRGTAGVTSVDVALGWGHHPCLWRRLFPRVPVRPVPRGVPRPLASRYPGHVLHPPLGDRSGTAARRRAAADAAASLYRTCPNRSPPRPAAVRVPLRDDRGHGGPRMSVRLAVEPTSGTLLQVAPHDGDARVWDDFIAAAEGGTFCHRAAWRGA